jgi:hypothetical protein
MTFDENKPDARDEEDRHRNVHSGGRRRDGHRDQHQRARAGRVTFTYYAGSVFRPRDGRPPVMTDRRRLDAVGELENLDDLSQPVGGASATREFRADGTFHW